MLKKNVSLIKLRGWQCSVGAAVIRAINENNGSRGRDIGGSLIEREAAMCEGQKQENMKKMVKLLSGMMLGLALASQGRADIVINYDVGSWGPVNFQLNPNYPGDTVSMQAYSGSGLILPDNTTVTAKINTLLFNVNYSDDGSYGSTKVNDFISSRLITITAPAAGGQTISQGGNDTVTASFDYVSLQSGQPIVFDFAGLGTITVTPLGLATGNVGDLGDHYYDVQASFLFTPVPEPTTMIAGALLLVPFGASALRIFRKNRAA